MKGLKQISKTGLVLALLVVMSAGAAPQGHPASAQTIQDTTINLFGARILYASLATADFNGDGYKEIVAGGSDGWLYVVSTSNGTNWSVVWSRQCNTDIEAADPPTHKSSNEIHASPAIADLDGDGHLDIVVAMGGDVHVDKSLRENGGVLVYRYSSAWSFALIESLSPDGTRGWPQPRIDQVGDDAGYGSPDGYWDGIVTTPALGDLDGDGDLEIVVAGIDRRIHAWHHTGQVVAGWPIYRYAADGSDTGDNLLRGGLSSPALGDLDDDGLPEVVVGSMSPYWDRVNPPNYNTATLWAINGDSTNVPGFPIQTEQVIYSSPALGDVDGDGKLEIVVGVGEGTSGRQNIVYAWNHDGAPLPNWPRVTAGVTAAPPALGDIDGDGALEVVIGCGNHYDPYSCNTLYAWNANGSSAPGFPVQPGSYSMPYSPVLADFDGDGEVEILVTHLSAGGITIVEPDGSAYDPSSYPFTGGLRTSPLVDDVDNDGKLEILAGGGNTNGVIQIWDENGDADVPPPWPMFHHDVARTGRYPLPPRLGFQSELRFYHQQGSGATEILYAAVQNLGEQPFDWQITESIADLQVNPASGVVSTGAAVQLTLNTTGYAAGVWHNLGSLTVAGSVAGQPVQSSPLTAPVWLYVGDVSRIYLPAVWRNH